MAHFAELDSNNNVIKVIVVRNEDILDGGRNESESIGIEFLQNLFGSDTIWKQTSYNNSFRKRYAGPGFTYDPENDYFLRPKLFPSWVLNETTKSWESPIGPHPETTDDMKSNGTGYVWDEDAHQADNTTGWVVEEMKEQH